MAAILNYFGVGGIIFILLTVFVEIAPIKINPIQWLGDRLNSNLKKDLDNLTTDFNHFKDEVRERDAIAMRRRIIAFDDELRHDPNKKHTEEQFNQVMDDIRDYNVYCDHHPNFQKHNHKAKFAIQNINDVYDKCRNNNSFLV